MYTSGTSSTVSRQMKVHFVVPIKLDILNRKHYLYKKTACEPRTTQSTKLDCYASNQLDEHCIEVGQLISAHLYIGLTEVKIECSVPDL